MNSINKLLKILKSKNVAEDLDEDKCDDIAQDVILGYNIDEDSRATWLETNQEAMRIIKHCEDDLDGGDKDFPFHGAAKVIYPLLAPAVIQMAARMSTHIVQNDKVCEFAVLGPDQPEMMPNPMYQQQMSQMQQQPAQPGQQPPQQQIPSGKGKKAEKAARLTDYASYVFLKKSKTWLKDTHKLMSIVASWGTAFRQVTYDEITKTAKHELIRPENVIINHNISSLEDAPRITILHNLRKNRIIELIRAGVFCNHDVDAKKKSQDSEVDIDSEGENLENGGDSREIRPNHEFLCQTLWLDLDEDGYAEPYKAYVHKKQEKLYGLYPAFKLKDVDLDPDSGKILSIKAKIDIVDYHLMDDPEGKFYSIGLNYLLLHPNKTLTSLARQLLDSGTLANTQGGFVTKAFKTNKRTLEFKMGEFQVLDVDPSINPQQHIIPLPFKEPSQVLFGLFQALIQSSKEIGFITDVLTGDVESQNTPATTMLAMVEQGTRAFKPVIQKLYISLKNEFTLWFEIESEYMKESKEGQVYAQFQGQPIEIYKSDFDLTSIDVCPVADPSMCSEAHKYAQLKMLTELTTNPFLSQRMDPAETLKTLLDGGGFMNADKLVAAPQPQPADPKLLKVQLDAQKHQDEMKIAQLNLQLDQARQQNDDLKTQIHQGLAMVKAHESGSKINLMKAKADKDHAEAELAARTAGHNHAQDMLDHAHAVKQAGDNNALEHRKLDVMETQQRNQGSPKTN